MSRVRDFLLLWMMLSCISLLVCVFSMLLTMMADIAFDFGIQSDQLRVFFAAFFYATGVAGIGSAIWAFTRETE